MRVRVRVRVRVRARVRVSQPEASIVKPPDERYRSMVSWGDIGEMQGRLAVPVDRLLAQGPVRVSVRVRVRVSF